MSNSTAIALIIASGFSGLFCVQYISKMANDLASEIVTGVTQGNSVPIKWRWLMLNQFWVPYAITAVGCAVGIAAVNMKIAEYAADAGVKPLAYLVAFFGVVYASGWLLTGASEYVYFRSVLRQAEAD